MSTMRPLFLTVVFAALAGPASALSPAAVAFVREAGLDPASREVVAADRDGEIRSTYRGKAVSPSLEALALSKSKTGVLMFVKTRAYIRRLEADFAGTPLEKGGFDRLYLTERQRTLVTRKIFEK